MKFFFKNFFLYKLYATLLMSCIRDVWGPPSALFHPEAEKDKIVICYSGEKYLSGLLTLDDIVAKNDEGLTTILEDALSK